MHQIKFFETNETYRRLCGPVMVAWDVTNQCNMLCRHCFNDSKYSPSINNELDSHYTDKLIDELIKMKVCSICLCGGEPLLRKDIKIIIDKLWINGIRVNIVSNGLLLSEENLKFLAGKITFLQISIDGSNATTHDSFRNTKGAFQKATTALQSASILKIPVSSSFCPNKKNFRELPDYVRLISNLGSRSIRMMQFLPQSRGLENEELVMSSEEQYEFQWLLRKQKQDFPHMKIEYGDPLEHIYSYPRQGIDTSIVEIRPNGDFAISPYLPLVFGNIKEMALSEAWKRGLKDAWKNPLTKQICSKVLSVSDLSQFGNPWKNIIRVF